jgi:hypothetical protein
VHLILSKLERIWFFSITARLARLSRPKGAEMRQRPYIVRAGNRCKVKRYKGEVLIALVLVLNVMPLTIICAVIYVYNK